MNPTIEKMAKNLEQETDKGWRRVGNFADCFILARENQRKLFDPVTGEVVARYEIGKMIHPY